MTLAIASFSLSVTTIFCSQELKQLKLLTSDAVKAVLLTKEIRLHLKNNNLYNCLITHELGLR